MHAGIIQQHLGNPLQCQGLTKTGCMHKSISRPLLPHKPSCRKYNFEAALTQLRCKSTVSACMRSCPALNPRQKPQIFKTTNFLKLYPWNVHTKFTTIRWNVWGQSDSTVGGALASAQYSTCGTPDVPPKWPDMFPEQSQKSWAPLGAPPPIFFK